MFNVHVGVLKPYLGGENLNTGKIIALVTRDTPRNIQESLT